MADADLREQARALLPTLDAKTRRRVLDAADPESPFRRSPIRVGRMRLSRVWSKATRTKPTIYVLDCLGHAVAELLEEESRR